MVAPTATTDLPTPPILAIQVEVDLDLPAYWVTWNK